MSVRPILLIVALSAVAACEEVDEPGRSVPVGGDTDADTDEAVATCCPDEGETELNAEAYASWTGVGEASYLGAARGVAAVGDWNGDGRAELALGAQGASGAMGAVYFVDGGATGAASVSEAIALTGSSSGDAAGFALAAAGDASGDGVADVLISSPGANAIAGAVYLVEGPVLASGELAAAATATFHGSEEAQMGFAVGSAGDHDGDGFADLIMGGQGANEGRGRVHLASGRAHGEVDLLTGSIAAVWGDKGEGAGWSVSAGDLTGDGVPDLAVGGLFDAFATGRAWLFAGPLEGELSTEDGIAVVAEEIGTSASVALELAGDYDGDGYADLAVGASRWDDPETPDSGRVYVLWGPVGADADLADADVFFDGQLGGGCGYSLSSTGRADGDDVDDLMIGCLNAWDPATSRGLVALIHGGFTSGTWPLASAGRRWTGAADNDVVGGGLGRAGDQDGDGIDDLLISAPGESTGGVYAGRVSVVLGASAF